MKSNPIRSMALVMLMAFASATAQAHDDATLDKMHAPNGGQLRMAGVYHFELVVDKDSTAARDEPVTVYLTDHAGNKISSAGASGAATILAGKSKTTVQLNPAGDNKLAGLGRYASDPKMTAVVTVTFADKTTEQARFTPKSLQTSTSTQEHEKEQAKHLHKG